MTSESQDFPERIGYACLNTVLRAQKPSKFCSRTARISTIREKGIDHVKQLGRQNVLDLTDLILWNEANGIRFMRMSSGMFPFASHETYGYSVSYCKDELEKVGELARKLNHRLTTHPGQTNNLGSPTRKVIEATRRDLFYHAEMLNLKPRGSQGALDRRCITRNRARVPSLSWKEGPTRITLRPFRVAGKTSIS